MHMSGMRKAFGLSSVLIAGTMTFAIPLSVPAIAQAQVENKTANADQAFPLLRGFLNLPAGERDQLRLGYVLRVKGASPSDVRITLSHNGQDTPIRIGADGSLSPLPTRAQLNGGAKVTISGPKSAGVSMKLRTYSTQKPAQTLDAKALAKGITQGNTAARKIAGVLAMAAPKLDRVVFVGGGGGVAVMADGNEQALPTYRGGDYASGTPYFVPAQMPNATQIRLNKTPSVILYDTPSK